MTIDNISPEGCFSILDVRDDGNHRVALCPGQWDRVPADLMTQVKEIWTEERLKAWEARQVTFSEEMQTEPSAPEESLADRVAELEAIVERLTGEGASNPSETLPRA